MKNAISINNCRDDMSWQNPIKKEPPQYTELLLKHYGKYKVVYYGDYQCPRDGLYQNIFYNENGFVAYANEKDLYYFEIPDLLGDN